MTHHHITWRSVWCRVISFFFIFAHAQEMSLFPLPVQNLLSLLLSAKFISCRAVETVAIWQRFEQVWPHYSLHMHINCYLWVFGQNSDATIQLHDLHFRKHEKKNSFKKHTKMYLRLLSEIHICVFFKIIFSLLSLIWDHWTSVLPMRRRRQPFKNTWLQLRTGLHSRRVCHQQTKTNLCITTIL